MKRNRAAALIAISTTFVAGTYMALRASSTISATPPTETPTYTPAFEGCAYVWAYQDLPEISAQVQRAVREVLPDASARATAFGEDCVFADGRAEFGALETDFYVASPVDDPNDTESLGNQIAAVMTIILERFPSESLPGGQDGFVEFRFEARDGSFTILRASIAKYRGEAQGLTGAKLFEFFRNNP